MTAWFEVNPTLSFSEIIIFPSASVKGKFDKMVLYIDEECMYVCLLPISRIIQTL